MQIKELSSDSDTEYIMVETSMSEGISYANAGGKLIAADGIVKI